MCGACNACFGVGTQPTSSMIEIICAWCGKNMGEKSGYGISGTSHGMCPDCYEEMRIEIIKEKRK